MTYDYVDQFVREAETVGVSPDRSQCERLAAAAHLLAGTARSRGISQYDDPQTALIRAMAPALAFFALDERPHSGRIADLGAGNGALGATIALLDPTLHVTLIDRARRSYTACELLIARMRLKNADCLLLDVDTGLEERYDGVVFRALACSARALTLAQSLTVPGGFVGAWHSRDDSGYLSPPHELRLLRTVDTVLPELVLTGYRT